MERLLVIKLFSVFDLPKALGSLANRNDIDFVLSHRARIPLAIL
jgi:hypothetical protein